MNKPQPKGNLIPVRDFKYPTKRGFDASVQYIYRLIAEHKNGKRASIPFNYKEIDKQIWIISN